MGSKSYGPQERVLILQCWSAWEYKGIARANLVTRGADTGRRDMQFKSH